MDIREYFQKEQKGFYKIIAKTLTTERSKQLYDAINDWHESELKLLGIADVSDSVTYQGVTYNWGDKVVSPNGYEFFVVREDGRWGLVDHGGTFCELQHCDLTGYLHCH